MIQDCPYCKSHLYATNIDDARICINPKCENYRIELRRLSDLQYEYQDNLQDDYWIEDDF